MRAIHASSDDHAADVSPAIFEPATVLPAQCVDRRALQPERRLMLAVLEDAVATLFGHGCTRGVGRRRMVEDVEGWFSSDDTDWPFAFVRICEGLGLDPDYIRTGLDRSRRANAAGPRASRPRPFRRFAGARHAIRIRSRRAV